MAGDPRLETFRRWRGEGVGALLDCLQSAPDARVPAYPEWDLRDLAVHVVRVYRMGIGALTNDTLERPPPDLPISPDDDLATIVDGVRQALDAAEAALDGCPHPRVWTPAGPREPHFWQRRFLREAVLHRWDAEQAVGAPTVPADEPALELVDEFLDSDIVRAFADDDSTLSGAVTIRSGDGRWTVDMEHRTVTRDARAAATISGAPPAVWLWLMGRDELPGTVSVDGDDGSIGVFTGLVGDLKRPSPRH